MYWLEKNGKIIVNSILVAMVAIVVSGCSTMSETRKTEASYVIYDVQPTTLNRSKLLDMITEVVQKNQEKVSVSRDIQMGELPDAFPKFVLKNPFANTQMGSLLAAQGQSLKVPGCDNAILTMSSTNNTASGNTSFFLCVIPYKLGYSVDIYSTFSSSSGGLSIDGLSKALAKSIAGDSSQYIPRTMAQVRDAAVNVGGTVKIVDSYIPDSFKGAFSNEGDNLKAN